MGSHLHAIVDSSGNIILPGFRPAAAPLKPIEEAFTHIDEDDVWTDELELPPVPIARSTETITPAPQFDVAIPWQDTGEEPEVVAERTDVWMNVRTKVYDVASDVLDEGVRQYATTLRDGNTLSKNVVDVVRTWGKKTWNTLQQPVWIPGRHKNPVQRSRGALFAADVVRFGGTFVGVFALLFVALNFQSFVSIAMSYVDGVHTKAVAEALSNEMNGVNDISKTPKSDMSLLAALPDTISAPDNRLVIPALNLNVPIESPSIDALIAEDWSKLEKDIQASLEKGVVHYPGTAEPGDPGNFFVTGHSSYLAFAPGNFKSVFARLNQLNVGDEYWVTYNGNKHRYIVREKKVVKPTDVTVLDQPIGKRLSTLMTCTPVGTNLNRLIVQAEEIDPVSGDVLAVGEKEQTEKKTVKTTMLPI